MGYFELKSSGGGGGGGGGGDSPPPPPRKIPYIRARELIFTTIIEFL